MEALVTKFESFLLTEKRVAHNTFDAYKRDIAQYANYLKRNNIALASAQIGDIKNFLQSLHDQQLSARSMARKISSLKMFYTYLNERHGFVHHARDLIMPKLEKKLPQFLSEQEVEQLLAATEHDKSDNGVRNKVMMYLLYTSGMRISELINIKKSSVHFDTGLLAVEGKGGKARMVPLPQEMLTMLREYLETVYPRLLIKNGQKYDSEYLFPVFYGKKIKPISRQSFWIILKKMARSCNLRDFVSPHKLRHSLATHMLRKGADLRSLQLLLGHEQISTIQIYTHLDTDHLRQEYDKKHPRS